MKTKQMMSAALVVAAGMISQAGAQTSAADTPALPGGGGGHAIGVSSTNVNGKTRTVVTSNENGVVTTKVIENGKEVAPAAPAAGKEGKPAKPGKEFALVPQGVEGHSSSKSVSEATTEVNGVKKTVIVTDDNGVVTTRVIESGPNGDVIKDTAGPGAAQEPRGYVGISAAPLSADKAALVSVPEGTGLLVEFVAEDGPAAAAGVKKSDVLTKLDDQILINPEQFRVLVRNHKKGDKIKLEILRAGAKQEVEVTAGQKVPDAADMAAGNGGGLNFDLGDVFGGGQSGAVGRILKIDPNGKIEEKAMEMLPKIFEKLDIKGDGGHGDGGKKAASKMEERQKALEEAVKKQTEALTRLQEELAKNQKSGAKGQLESLEALQKQVEEMARKLGK